MCANETLNRARATGNPPYFGDVCLLGLGVTGQAVAGYFALHPESYKTLTVYPGKTSESTLAYLATLPENFVILKEGEQVTGSFTTTVVSPGIPPHSDLFLHAEESSVEIISEPELAWRISPEKWVAVTGTNGKTTVTSLITSLLLHSEMRALSAGNIGRPCIEAIDSRLDTDWIVAELSSYQLHSTAQLAADAGVLLNITPDHLSWHGTHEKYYQDKLRLFSSMAPDKPAIIDCIEPATREIADDLATQGKRVIRVGSEQGLTLDAATISKLEQGVEIAYVDAATGALCLRLQSGSYMLLPADELLIKGPHNTSNALASAAVAAVLGATEEQISAGLKAFRPLTHRFEPCGDVNGVSFINDSKATNTDASQKALSSFEGSGEKRVIALFGGRDKGTDLSELTELCERSCRYAVCYGEAGERFFAAMNSKLPAVREATFDDAFKRAFELARVGDTVLLSPACASFDEFTSFEARGEYFKVKIAELRGDDDE